MKSFFTSFFATLSALFVFCCGAVVVFFVMIAAFAALGEKKVAVTPGSYLVFDLSVAITDAPSQMEGIEDLAEAFGGHAPRRLQLRQATRALQAAAADPDIAGVLLRGNFSSEDGGSGFAALREVRAALEEFRHSGKPVKAFINFATTRDYYVSSVASEITLDPYGVIAMPGLASQPMFFAGAFEKFGIGVQVTRVGKYKSAVEPYTRKDMSPENRAQVKKLLDDVWADLVAGIEDGRKLKAGTLQRVVDADGLLRGEAALKAGLADRVAYWDVVLDDLKNATGRKGSKDSFKQIELRDYSRLVSGNGLVARRQDMRKVAAASTGKLAIIYAEGTIVDGSGKDEGTIYGDVVARQLRDMRLDDSVKAVVLRVNSPGGSASASETIQREVRLLREKKPVVVSMGTLAASGGYWISTYANRIFAEQSTITGSIGVFGMFLNFQGLMTDKLGLTFDVVKTGKFADSLTVTRPKTDEELAMFQHMVDWIYGEFIGKVAESRNLKPEVVREIAQGRVWSGAEAQKLGLVDEMGGLSDAIQFATKKAGLGADVRVIELPRHKQFGEALAEAFDPRKREQSNTGPLGVLIREVESNLRELVLFNDPRGVYARLPFDVRLQ